MDHWEYFERSAILIGTAFTVLAALEPFRRPDVLGESIENTDLRNLAKRLPISLSRAFDDWFGERSVSWISFQRSLFVSAFAFLLGIPILISWTLAIRPKADLSAGRFLNEFFVFYEVLGLSVDEIATRVAVVMPLLVLANPFFHYIALVKTRALMRLGTSSFAQQHWSVMLPILALAELCVSLLIVLIEWFSILHLLQVLQHIFGEPFRDLAQVSGLSGHSNDPVVFLLIWPTLLTTILGTLWVWLFCGGTLAARMLATLMRPVWNLVKWVVDVKRFPFVAMGLSLAITVAMFRFAVWVVLTVSQLWS